MADKRGYSKFFEGLNYAGAILTVLAGVGVVAATTRLGARCSLLLGLVLAAFVLGQCLVLVSAVGTARIRFTLRNVIALFVLYTLLSFWDTIAIFIGLPAIALTMLMGPLMFVVWALATFVLGMYLVEGVIGYDVQGMISLIETPIELLGTLGVWIVSGLVLVWHVGWHDSSDWLIDRAASLIYALREQLKGMAVKIVERDRII